MGKKLDKLYLFHGNNYVGYFDVLGAFDLVFHKSTDILDSQSKILLSWNDLSTKEKINAWLSARVKPDARADKSVWLSISGIKARDNWDILVENHCLSYNDTFWWNTEKSNRWFEEFHPFALL